MQEDGHTCVAAALMSRVRAVDSCHSCLPLLFRSAGTLVTEARLACMACASRAGIGGGSSGLPTTTAH